MKKPTLIIKLVQLWQNMNPNFQNLGIWESELIDCKDTIALCGSKSGVFIHKLLGWLCDGFITH